jgi:opacity protein-like surface antigen
MRLACGRVGSFFILAAAILLGSTQDLAAQTVTQPGTLTATPFIGVSFGTSGNVDDSLGLGVGIGYDLTSNIGFEGEFSQALDVAGKDDNVDWSLTNISGNVLYHFNLQGPATPYATFGLGWEHSGIDVKNPDPTALYLASSTEFAYNFGGGVKYRVSDRFLARGDLRRFQANDFAPDHWRLYEIAKR